jgi:hypothetical protein
MAPSYKPLWQHERQRADQLEAEVQRLRGLIAASPDEILHELERTRKIVDLAGIARHMRAQRYTPQQWKQRGHLPPVDFPEISEPLWYATTIVEKFVIPTRRLWYDFPPGELSPAA